MLSRDEATTGSKPARTKLEAAIVASLLAMGALNLVVLIGQIAPAKAYAATPCHCVGIKGMALA